MSLSRSILLRPAIPALSLALPCCSLLSGTGPLKGTIQDQAQAGAFELVEVRSETQVPRRSRSYGLAQVPPRMKGEGYSDRIRARDNLVFVVTDLSEQSPFYSKGSVFRYGPLEVPEDGLVSIPYVGALQVIDRSLAEVAADLAEKVRPISKTAQVNVSRSGRLDRTANVLGKVRNPGPVPLDRKGLTSVDALAAAGGPGEAEHLFHYLVRRGGRDYRFDYLGFRANPFPLEEGDLITLTADEDNRFHVMGAVNKPTTVPFPSPHPTLADALGAGIGFNEQRSDPSGLFVFRPGSPSTVYTFDLRNPSVLPLVQKFPIKGQDLVYVTEAPLSRWNRLITQILPISISQAANSAARYGN
jgi:polysaccharide export outer membrane protein